MDKRTNMNRRRFVTTMGTALLGLSTCRSKTPSRPNVILILADDLGYGDLGCYGQQQIKTPNLDEMARQGMRFTQFYAGSTVCAPSRCTLLTGKHTGHCTVRGNVNVLMKADELSLAKTFKKAGYQTACIGKWGVGHPPPPDDPHKQGFDHFFGYLSMWHAHNYYPEFLWRNGEKISLDNKVQHPEQHYKSDQRTLVGLAGEKNVYSHDLFTFEALDFMQNNRNSPFFLYLAYTIPHANNEASGFFNQSGMEVPDYGIYKDKDWPEPEKGRAAMISRMDRDIGRIIKTLKESGLEENTLIIFSSDNGPHREGKSDPAFHDSNGPLRGIKRDLYEGGIRVPMIAKWPQKIKAGATSDHMGAFWDFLPTFADLFNTPVAEEIDGISFLPELLGRSRRQQRHAYLYWEFHGRPKKQAIRMGKWKAVKILPDSKIELYDVEKDLSESQNLADRYPKVVQKAELIFQTARSDGQMWSLYAE